MNGYHGWNGNGYEYGWDGSMMGGHPYVGGDVMAVLMPMVFFCLVLALALVAFQIWLYYRIFAKAGYNGWWSLLALIPGVGTLVVMLVLAFDNWPIHRGEVGGSPMTAAPPTAPVNVAAQASAYNPYQAPIAGAAPAPVPTASAEPPVPPVAAPAAPVEPAPAAPSADAPEGGGTE